MYKAALIALWGLLTVVGCSSVTPVGEFMSVRGDGCTVEVFQTKAQAELRGAIIEKCVIEGTSSGSFSHTPATAIKKHASKACKCGADKVYVQSRSPMGMGVATASMVAFSFADMPQATNSQSSSYINELKALAKLRDDGIITEAEFQKQKSKILGR